MAQDRAAEQATTAEREPDAGRAGCGQAPAAGPDAGRGAEAGSDPAASADAAPRRMRADAARNRDRLVEAAAARFAAEGVETSLEAIARDAGLGIGTLYRHFPTREHLVGAVYRRELDLLCGAAPALLASLPPDRALEAWMMRMIDYMETKRGLASSLKLLMEAGESCLFADVRDRLTAALGALLRAGVEAGTLRGDVDELDVFQALGGLYNAGEGAEWRGRAERLVSIVIGGLRAG
ncbi:MAG: TetR/AcrR family transcriptional regulator [Pseudomonadota bacterium]|nr:TetR/AcrR family transcriptional regulator [Pseudomonadota bacterium]